MSWLAQFIVTILISTLVPSTIIKTIGLLLFWIISFWPVKSREWIYFIACSVIFTISNYGALKNLTFTFTHQDIILMPYNEIFMWGFYCLNAYRLLSERHPWPRIPALKKQKIKVLVYTVLFAASFSVVKGEVNLATFLFLILMVALTQFRSKLDIAYMLYFLFMGVVVESSGLARGLWHYPSAEFFEAPLWAPLMWMNIGLIMSQITPWFLSKSAKN